MQNNSSTNDDAPTVTVIVTGAAEDHVEPIESPQQAPPQSLLHNDTEQPPELSVSSSSVSVVSQSSMASASVLSAQASVLEPPCTAQTDHHNDQPDAKVLVKAADKSSVALGSSKNVKHCQACGVKFGFFTRKHSCFQCKRAFCWKCAPHRLSIHAQNKRSSRTLRVCTSCFETQQQWQNNPSPSVQSVPATDDEHKSAAPHVRKDIAHMTDQLMQTYRKRMVALQRDIVASVESEHSASKKATKSKIKSFLDKMERLKQAIRQVQKQLDTNYSILDDIKKGVYVQTPWDDSASASPLLSRAANPFASDSSDTEADPAASASAPHLSGDVAHEKNHGDSDVRSREEMIISSSLSENSLCTDYISDIDDDVVSSSAATTTTTTTTTTAVSSDVDTDENSSVTSFSVYSEDGVTLTRGASALPPDQRTCIRSQNSGDQPALNPVLESGTHAPPVHPVAAPAPPQLQRRVQSPAYSAQKRRIRELHRKLNSYQKKFCNMRDEQQKIELEYYFPSVYKWKFSVCVNDGVYIGFKDLGLDNLQGSFSVRADGGRIVVRMTDVIARLQIYEFKMRGRARSIKLLAAILSPRLVTLDLEGREIVIPLSYHDRSRTIPAHAATVGDGAAGKGWVMDRDAIIKLSIRKNIRGAATAPDSFVQWIANTLIPVLLRRIVSRGIPDEIGNFLLNARHNRVEVAGQFKMKGDLRESTWHADLSSSNQVCSEARSLLNVTQECMSAFVAVCRSLKLSEFKRGKSVSMYTLYAYMKRYSVEPRQWKQLIELWNSALHATLSASQQDNVLFSAGNTMRGGGDVPVPWFYNMLDRLRERGRKNIDIQYRMSTVFVSLDVWDSLEVGLHMFRKVIELQLVSESDARNSNNGNNDSNNKKKKKKKKYSTAQLLRKYGEERLDPFKVMQDTTALIATIKEFVDKVMDLDICANLGVQAKVLGGKGSDSSFEIVLSDVKMSGKLPAFSLHVPRMKSISPAMDVTTQCTPDGNYVIDIVMVDPGKFGVTYPFSLHLIGLDVGLFRQSVVGGVEVCIEFFRLGGPIAPLLDISRLMVLETLNDHLQPDENPAGAIRGLRSDATMATTMATMETTEMEEMEETKGTKGTTTTATTTMNRMTMGTPAKIPSSSSCSSLTAASVSAGPGSRGVSSHLYTRRRSISPPPLGLSRFLSPPISPTDDHGSASAPNSPRGVQHAVLRTNALPPLQDGFRHRSSIIVVPAGGQLAPSPTYSIADAAPMERGSSLLRIDSTSSLPNVPEKKGASAVLLEYLYDEKHGLEIEAGVSVSIDSADPMDDKCNDATGIDDGTEPQQQQTQNQPHYRASYSLSHIDSEPHIAGSAIDDAFSKNRGKMRLSVHTSSSEDQHIVVKVKTDLEGVLGDIMGLL